MKRIAYIRVSTNKQDLNTQKLQIFEYCRIHNLAIDYWFVVETSSKQSQEARKITALKKRLKAGDLLIATELSRLGRGMLETILLVLELESRGVSIIFIRQPELTTFNNATSKLLLSIYAYVAETEREFISLRTKAGLQNAKAKGKRLGRPKNSLSSVFDKDIEQIKLRIAQGECIKEIWRILGYEKLKTYEAFLWFCKSRNLILDKGKT
ncbi:recombinase family protein [Helicobacter rodentium]|uniref:recombinase family protein n=1 Tax=Helicobacter rodentium TaxID=59617 RepID=UPI002356F8E4|nr:recombinase family protein [Helicobacter rodentium]